jgi:hypothetical protein
MPSTNWRELTPAVRSDFFHWVADSMGSRHAQGALEHGDIFTGDPIDQAIEENLDSLFYLWMAKKQQREILRVAQEAGVRISDLLKMGVI